MYIFSDTASTVFSITTVVFSIISLVTPLMVIGVFIMVFVKMFRSSRDTFKNVKRELNDINNLSSVTEDEIRNTPKSVSGMTSIYLPVLQRDFPELNYEEFKNMAVNELKKQLSLSYDSFIIHRTELYRYSKSQGTCTAVFQSSVEYQADGLKNQTRYNTHMVYVQNSDLSEEEDSFSTTCPNCGAPITRLGHMSCEYCGSAIVPVNVKVWKFLKTEEV